MSSEEGTDNIAHKKQQAVIKKRTLREDWLSLTVGALTDSAGDGSESVCVGDSTHTGRRQT